MKRLLVILSALCLTLGGLAGCQKHEHIFSQATCTEPAACEKCGDTYGEALGHDFSDVTCTLSKTCNLCGITEGEALGHTYRDASCTTPATCLRCDAIKGEPLGHNLTEATCTEPATCKTCGTVFGIPLGHSYSFAEDAACTDHMICSRCGKESTTVLGHMMVDATCEMTEYCERCGFTGEPALGHDYREATCTLPQICKRCEEPNGNALGHSYTEATCEQPKTCMMCGKEDGEPLGHSYTDGVCIRCELPDPELQWDNLYLLESNDSYKGLRFGIEDTFGNYYESGYRYESYGKSVHNLSGKYKTFSGTFVVAYWVDPGKTANMRIYADDKLVYNTTLTRTDGKVSFNVDVTNATSLTIEIYKGASGFTLYLIDPKLTK